ncbi:putative Myb transcription factor [Calycina marina]|uniref:Myb transcription factor n=1 Tax=Calycina marina TaxID=1763456 RepID=A0A9P7Z5U8_9HELO|nr:putative Myb transcription factor [Calycina marina]
MPQPPHRWLPEEDEILRREVLSQCKFTPIAEGALKDWQCIASSLPGRTNKDCRKRWHNVVSGGMNKGHWTQAEDKLLTDAVENYGKSWIVVANKIKSRNADQCSKRWNQFLDPELDRSQWTDDENQLLLEACKKKGRQWKEIQVEHFPSRSRNAIKNQYTILSRRNKNGQTGEANLRLSRMETEASELVKTEEPKHMEDHEMSFLDSTDLPPGLDLSNTDVMMDLSASLDEHDFSANTLTNWDAYVGNTTDTLSHWTTDPPLLDTVTQNTGSMQDLAQFFPAEDFSDWSNTDTKHDLSKPVHLTSFDFTYQNMYIPAPDEPLYLPDSSHKLLLDPAVGHNSQQQNLQPNTITVTPQDSDSPGSMPDDNPAKITLTIHNPSSLTVEQLMKIAMGNKSGFRFERD